MPGASPQVSFRQYPLRYLLVFPALHTTIAWGLLGPTYLFLSATGLTPLFLAGPQGVTLLKTRIPNLVPNGLVYGLRDCRASVQGRGNPEPTIEEWMETSIKKAASGTWSAAKNLRSIIARVRGLSTPEGVESEVERWAKSLQDKGMPRGDEAQDQKNAGPGPVRAFITNQASGVKVRDLADGVAAWVLIKCLLPLRIPLSLWLTPRVVRMTLRRGA
ncbi:unnamed protein product [Parajaminaea phylloscopi]